MYKHLFSALALLLSVTGLKAQDPHQQLRADIKQIAATSKGVVGVSMLSLEDHDTVSYNGNARLVMHSVMKIPVAMTVLHLIDLGKLKLDKTIRIKEKDLPKTFSPLRDKYPKGNVDMPISELLSYMVSQSDNDACDILIKKIGGTEAVENYMFMIGIKGISIRATEAEMSAAWEAQFTDWCKPAEMTRLLELIYKGSVLSRPSNDFLLKIMTESSTGLHRIKGLIPDGTIVAHKTGTSPTNEAGLSPATNDVGIITLPNGKHLALSIFVCNSTADEATRDLVIAKIAKIAFDFYNK